MSSSQFSFSLSGGGIPSAYNFSFQPTAKTDEEGIEELNNYCQEILYGTKSNPLNMQLRSMAQGIMAQLSVMQRENKNVIELLDYAKLSLSRLKTAEELCQVTNLQFQSQTTAFQLLGNELKSKLATSSEPPKLLTLSCTSNSIASALSSTPSTTSALFQAHLRDQAHLRMTTAQLIATPLSYLEKGISGWMEEISANIARQGAELAQRHPELHANYEKIATFCKTVAKDLAEKGIDAIKSLGAAEFVQKFVSACLKPNHALQQQLIEMGISQEEAKSYQNNLQTSLPYLMPFGIVGRVGKAGAATLTSATPYFVKAQRASSLKHQLTSITNIIKQHPSNTLFSSIRESTKETLEVLTNYGNISGGEVASWLAAIDHTTKPMLTGVSSFYHCEQLEYKVVQLSRGLEKFIVKESYHHSETLAELIGLNFLHSLNLRHWSLPESIAIGTRMDGKVSFFAKSYLPGKSLGLLMDDAGMESHGNVKMQLMQDLGKITHAAGKAFGELNKKGLPHSRSDLAKEAAECAIDNLFADLEFAERAMAEVGIKTRLVTSKQFDAVAKDLRAHPGQTSYGLVDIHGHQFICDAKSTKPFGHIDAECLPFSLSTNYEPIRLLGQEYHAFLASLETDALFAGLSRLEGNLLKRQFSKGYFEEFGSPHAPAAEKFFKIYYDIQKISHIANQITANGGYLFYVGPLKQLVKKYTS